MKQWDSWAVWSSSLGLQLLGVKLCLLCWHNTQRQQHIDLRVIQDTLIGCGFQNHLFSWHKKYTPGTFLDLDVLICWSRVNQRNAWDTVIGCRFHSPLFSGHTANNLSQIGPIIGCKFHTPRLSHNAGTNLSHIVIMSYWLTKLQCCSFYDWKCDQKVTGYFHTTKFLFLPLFLKIIWTYSWTLCFMMILSGNWKCNSLFCWIEDKIVEREGTNCVPIQTLDRVRAIAGPPVPFCTLFLDHSKFCTTQQPSQFVPQFTVPAKSFKFSKDSLGSDLVGSQPGDTEFNSWSSYPLPSQPKFIFPVSPIYSLDAWLHLCVLFIMLSTGTRVNLPHRDTKFLQLTHTQRTDIHKQFWHTNPQPSRNCYKSKK